MIWFVSHQLNTQTFTPFHIPTPINSYTNIQFTYIVYCKQDTIHNCYVYYFASRGCLCYSNFLFNLAALNDNCGFWSFMCRLWMCVYIYIYNIFYYYSININLLQLQWVISVMFYEEIILQDVWLKSVIVFFFVFLSIYVFLFYCITLLVRKVHF